MPHAARYPRRRERALEHLRELGYNIRASPNWLRDTGHTAGTPAERAADLNELFADRDVRVIMTSIGGYNGNQLLDLLDYELIRRNPKPLIGYSDTTALLVSIWQRTQVGVVLGPQLLPQFGEFGGALSYTRQQFQRVMGSAAPLGVVPIPTEEVVEFLPWDEADDRPRAALRAVPPRSFREGESSGFLVGGNLATLLSLAGTQYWPDLEGAILLLESTIADLPQLTSQLTQLRQLGVFDQIAGLALGRFTDPGFDGSESLRQMVIEETEGFEGPVVAGMPFGHTDPMLCVPFGARAVLSAAESVVLTVLDSAVTE